MNEFRIEQFKKMGLGLFVHFGLYSQVGKGEWFYSVMHEEGMDPDGYRSLMKSFKIFFVSFERFVLSSQISLISLKCLVINLF